MIQVQSVPMAVSLLGLNLDFFLNGLTSNSRRSLRKFRIMLSFQLYTSISFFYLTFFMCLGVETNLSYFEGREISSLERWRLDKLITLALTSFPSYIITYSCTVNLDFSHRKKDIHYSVFQNLLKY